MQRASSMNLQMVGVRVGIRIDAERHDPHLARRARDANRDLAAIRDQQACGSRFAEVCAGAAFEKRAQPLLSFRADALLRDRAAS